MGWEQHMCRGRRGSSRPECGGISAAWERMRIALSKLSVACSLVGPRPGMCRGNREATLFVQARIKGKCLAIRFDSGWFDLSDDQKLEDYFQLAGRHFSLRIKRAFSLGWFGVARSPQSR